MHAHVRVFLHWLLTPAAQQMQAHLASPDRILPTETRVGDARTVGDIDGEQVDEAAFGGSFRLPSPGYARCDWLAETGMIPAIGRLRLPLPKHSDSSLADVARLSGHGSMAQFEDELPVRQLVTLVGVLDHVR